jgi:hypothetical protein
VCVCVSELKDKINFLTDQIYLLNFFGYHTPHPLLEQLPIYVLQDEIPITITIKIINFFIYDLF